MIDNKLIDTVAAILADQKPPTEEALRNIVKAQAMVLALTSGTGTTASLSDLEIENVVKALETRFSIRMELGSMFEADDYKPWLASRQGQIDWFYRNRYRKHLLKKSFPPHVVATLDRLTDKILDHLEDPLKEGTWARKGLVVGHVQSGKTANYAGLVCKAADAGFRVIVVLAGTLNTLRNQTQERMDADFCGWCTLEKKHIGASTFGNQRRPVCFTTSSEDFKKQTANAIAVDLSALNEPVVFIIKKNKSTLTNLIEWLSSNNRHKLQNFPMLLIDDEADYASINTKKEDDSPATINFAIRNLLSIFTRTSFVGYTATPFANIFIDPESEDEMENGVLYSDLFPRDFILSLDPPDNYVGPHRLFNEDANLDCVRDITDNALDLPIRHKIDFVPNAMPASLQRAIGCFIISRAIRLLRDQTGKCHSMMVNASRFTRVQNLLANMVLNYLRQLQQSIANYSALAPQTALENQDLRFLKEDVFDEEFALAGFEWSEVQKILRESASPIEVLTVNSNSSDTLDYRSKNYPNGRSVIVVGGVGLSRGLTLDGLITSYFLRNTVMYDTLMQMGRWFGYRDGYENLCRIFMAPEAASWYAHISEATEELRRDFKSMERARLTPKDFGLRVRSHPTSLIVTARNKMRTGKSVPMNIALEGRLAATSILLGDKDSLEQNAQVLSTVCDQCEKERTSAPEKLGYLWKNVSPSIIVTAIQNFRNHPECMLTYADPLVQYIEWMATQQKRFDVLLRSLKKDDVLLRSVKEENKGYHVGSRIIIPIKRTVETLSDHKIIFNKRRVGSKGDESAGLAPSEIAEVHRNYPGKNIPDSEYRKVKDRNPLFLIYFARVNTADDNLTSKTVPAYSVSFPGDPSSGRPAMRVQYVVNTKWWEQNYGNPDEDTEDEHE